MFFLMWKAISCNKGLRLALQTESNTEKIVEIFIEKTFDYNIYMHFQMQKPHLGSVFSQRDYILFNLTVLIITH